MRLAYFQLVDRVVSLDLAARIIRSESVVPNESTIFEGHFPSYPLMPGVLLIECMAQTSGWLLLATTSFQRMPLLASVKEAKLRTFVRPGQKLIIEAKIAHEGSGFAITDTSITCEGKPICDATITLRLVPFPNPELAKFMRQTAAAIGLPSSEALADG